MYPTIYGIGSGDFNTVSIQVPTIIRSALEDGQASVLGGGKTIWDHVHIADLVLLYEVVLAKVLAGDDIPSGEKGIFFSETGENTFLDLSQVVANAGFALGVLKTPKCVTSLSKRVRPSGATATSTSWSLALARLLGPEAMSVESWAGRL